ncbi:unnamed protein product [Vicia faba]|uniref:Protein BIC1 n=1 Tax=Vicia faba TaxID=3906 RepID=A0AAV1B099_VICFA|nr:unnamed protein product [Vicia faba]
MSHQSSADSDDKIPSHPSKDANFEKKQDDPFLLSTQKSQNHDDKDKASFVCNKEKMASAMDDVEVEAKELTTVDEELEEMSERERLKRHRVEVAGRVWIPEIWGQEELLKDWIDCTAFDAPLIPSKITMARAALVQQGTARANAAPLSIDNRC